MDNIIYKELKLTISENKTEAVLKILLERSQYSLSKAIYNDAILLSSRHAKLFEEYHKGVLSPGEFNIEFTKIKESILNLIDESEKIDQTITTKNSLNKTNVINVQKNETNENKTIEKGKKINLYRFTKSFIDFENIEISETIKFHLSDIRKWSNIVKFSNLNKAKVLTNIYVDLEYYLTPLRLQSKETTEEENESIPLNELLSKSENHIIIIGQPGAGKTTTVKKIIYNVLNDIKIQSITQTYTYPVLIRLRDLNLITESVNIEKQIYITILNTLGLEFSFGSEKNRLSDKYYKANGIIFRENENFIKQLIIDLINKLKLIIILDGFDELANYLKKPFLNQISEMMTRLTESKIILTSRTGEINQDIADSTVYEIKALSDVQIKKFIEQWLDNAQASENLYNQIQSSPFYDTAIRPLTLAHLCAIYEKYKRIPEKPKSIYKRIVNLLLEEWDRQRDIARASKYADFEVDRKSEFLSHLSYTLTILYKTSTFDYRTLSEAYEKICPYYNLPISEKNVVIDEIESHTGILIQNGYDKFEFAHKSIQE